MASEDVQGAMEGEGGAGGGNVEGECLSVCPHSPSFLPSCDENLMDSDTHPS